MKRIKIVTIVGTRPEIIRLSRIIIKLDKYSDHILVHTGQNYDFELNEIFFKDLDLRQPDFYLNAAGENAASTIAKIIESTDKLLNEIKPDALLILGDTNSALAAIPAKRLKIPIFHMEAGNRCFDLRVPEEVNRKIVDHISDINLPYSEIARNYLIKEGLPPDQIIRTGSPMGEVLFKYQEKYLSSNILTKLCLVKNEYFLVSLHREENVDNAENLLKFVEILNSLAKEYNFPVIVSTHPRTKKRLDNLNYNNSHLIQFLKPFGFTDYINLQINSKCVLSDSGTITEESSILNFPAINLREVHERPEGFEEASVMFAGLDLNLILNCLNIVEDQSKGDERTLNLVKDYKDINLSDKIPRIIFSYIKFINQKTYKKYN
jgi:UDP-N-acetylglucosamine 2-epimerase (non-hydrolysing)